MPRTYGEGTYGSGTYGEPTGHIVELVYQGRPFLADLKGLHPTPPPAAEGDRVYFQALMYAPNSTADISGPPVVDEWELMCSDTVTEGAIDVGWMAVYAATAHFEPFTETITPSPVPSLAFDWPTNASTNLATFTGRWLIVRGQVSEVCVFSGPHITANQSTPTITLASGLDLIVQTVMSTGHGDAGDALGTYMPGTLVRRKENVGAWYLAWTRTTPGGVTTESPLVTQVDAPADSGETGVYWLVAFALTGEAFERVVGHGDFRRLSLDCAEIYQALITGPDYREVVGSVGWSQIEWSRSLDEISTASVTIPDRLGGAKCCLDYGGLLPWRFGLTIERNDVPVWSGPVTTLSRQGESLRVQASDVLARFQHRLPRRDRSYVNKDSGEIFAGLINMVQFESDRWAFISPVGRTGEVTTREIVARDFEMTYDTLQELANESVDFFILDGTLYVHDYSEGWVFTDGSDTRATLEGPYTASMELAYGTFTEDHWEDRPNWTINGTEQANAVWIAGPENGEDGTRRFWLSQDLLSQSTDGVLDYVDSDPMFRPEDETIPDAAFQFGADSTLALRRIAPAVIEGGSLAEGAPVDVPNLRPGSLWLCDIFDACFGQLLQIARLKRVQVTVSAGAQGITETIAPTLIPPGGRD